MLIESAEEGVKKFVGTEKEVEKKPTGLPSDKTVARAGKLQTAGNYLSDISGNTEWGIIFSHVQTLVKVVDGISKVSVNNF